MTDADAVSRETRERLLALVPDPVRLQRYHDLLADDGVRRGLVGPRETPRLWERHIANSAVVVLPPSPLVPAGARVIDVGSGAGLPGIVWAIVRPDLRVTLVEPLLRRYTFLQEVTRTLDMAERVTVLRSRAEDLIGTLSADVVTARAVAPLDRLLGWTAPLVRPGGSVLAFKGSSAAKEIESARSRILDVGGTGARVVTLGQEVAHTATTVVVVDIGR